MFCSIFDAEQMQLFMFCFAGPNTEKSLTGTHLFRDI